LVETLEKMSDLAFAKNVENDITKMCFERNIYWNIPVYFGQTQLHWSTLDICYLSVQRMQANILLQTVILDI